MVLTAECFNNGGCAQIEIQIDYERIQIQIYQSTMNVCPFTEWMFQHHILIVQLNPAALGNVAGHGLLDVEDNGKEMTLPKMGPTRRGLQT